MNAMKIAIIALFACFAQAAEPLPKIPEISIDANKKQEPTPPTQNTIDTELNQQTPVQQELPAGLDLPSSHRDPFTPLITPKESGRIDNNAATELFSRSEISLPTTARRIKKIAIEYQNINGSIATQEQAIEGDIDWHFPLVLLQEVQDQTIEIPDVERIEFGGNFSADFSDKEVVVYSGAKLLRDFALANPPRVVLDFEAKGNALKAMKIPQILMFKEVALTTHLNFHRVSITLDGQYLYELKQDENGIIITFK